MGACEVAPVLDAKGADQGVRAVQIQVVHDQMNRLRRPVPTCDPLQRGAEPWRFAIPGRVRQVSASRGFDDAVDVGGALPHVLVVLTGDLARCHGPARSARAAQRHRTFIERYDGLPAIVRTREHVQYILHARDVLSVQRGDAPRFFPPRLQLVVR
jgi:hypothetical protein